MQTEKLGIGISIHGVDANVATAAELSMIKDLLYKNRLIVLKDQALSEQQYCDLANRFGFPVPYLQENYRHPDFPLIFVSSNVKSNGKQIGVPRTGGYWHSDTSFEKEPKVITMLMPKVLPANHPRSTKFVDMASVYAELPQATKDKLAGTELLHSGRFRYKIRSDNVGYDIFEILQAIDAFAPPMRHPAVIEHPYTKEKVLYANSGFTIGIADRSLDESAALLREIFTFAESDRFVREVRWAMGDIIIWDNRFLCHTSGRNTGPEEETMMHRITLQDGYPLCASQMQVKAACCINSKPRFSTMCTTASLLNGDLPAPTDPVAASCAAKSCCKLGCPSSQLPRANDETVNLPIAISSNFISEILRPYRPHSRYLKEAVITSFRDKTSEGPASAGGLIIAEGKFAIGASCYIDDTGHFNAVEFNICYNQLAYVMFGKCVAEGLMHRLRCERVEVPTFSEFKRHQLPNMVIVDIESRYYRQLDSRSFTGTLRLERVSPLGGAWFFFTTMNFADREGVKAKGSVVLAFNPSFAPLAH